MYLSYFGLTEKPFSITPDPRYLYMSDLHREAMAHLTYGVTEGGGFVQLTGEVGTGKTTICRCLLDQLPDKVIVALISNPRVNERQFLATVCDELGIKYPVEYSSKTLIDLLNTYLLEAHASGARVVLIVDEAQNLSRGVLERVRLLTNLETAKKKLLQIILIGQPELVDTLRRPDLRQLAQRITARYALDPLSRKDIKAYIAHRLSVAGSKEQLFSPGAIRLVHKHSEGIPRLINVLCDHALLGAYSQGASHVTKKIMQKAAREVFGKHSTGGWLRPAAIGIAGLATVASIAGIMVGGGFLSPNSAGERSNQPVIGQVESTPEAVAMAGTDTVPNTANPNTTAVVVAGVAANPITNESAASLATATDDPIDNAQVTTVRLDDGQGSLDVTAPLSAQAIQLSQAKLSEKITQAGERASLGNGFAGLIRRWGRPGVLNGEETACDAGFRLGLGCLTPGGGWDELDRLNRVALLGLDTDSGEKRYVIVTALTPTDVTIDISGIESTHPRQAFEPYWDGSFTLLWRPPVTASVIRPGAPGDEVIWLRRALDYVLRESSEADNSPEFDEPLAERVRRVQSSLGLEPSGEVESRTLIMLNTLLYAANDGTPVIRPL